MSYLEPTNLVDNFVTLDLGSTKTINFQVQSAGSDLSVVAYLDTNKTVTSSFASTAASVTLQSSLFPTLGTYLLRTEVQSCKGSGRNKDLIVYHEEAITGLNVIENIFRIIL